jgi:hypothetical protein
VTTDLIRQINDALRTCNRERESEKKLKGVTHRSICLTDSMYTNSSIFCFDCHAHVMRAIYLHRCTDCDDKSSQLQIVASEQRTF